MSPPMWSEAEARHWVRTSIVRKSFYTLAHLIEDTPELRAQRVVIRAAKKLVARAERGGSWGIEELSRAVSALLKSEKGKRKR